MEAKPDSGRRRAADATPAFACAIALFASLAGGCASVTVDAGNQQVTARGLLGARVIDTSLQPIAVHSRGFGVFTTADAVHLGWQRQTLLYLDERSQRCHVVLVGNTPEQARAGRPTHEQRHRAVAHLQ